MFIHMQTRQAAIENTTTTDERRPKIARNRSPDCHQSPDRRQMATERKQQKTSDPESAPVGRQERSRPPPIRCNMCQGKLHVAFNLI